MARALRNNDVETIGRMAEEDTLNLHASTMTGKAHMILWEPETLRIVKSVQQMRAEGVPAWFSMDTGPSVFVNASKKHTREVAERLRRLGCCHIIESNVGDEPFLTDDHLF
jgi:phosphomevalonate decarboxylase